MDKYEPRPSTDDDDEKDSSANDKPPRRRSYRNSSQIYLASRDTLPSPRPLNVIVRELRPSNDLYEREDFYYPSRPTTFSPPEAPEPKIINTVPSSQWGPEVPNGTFFCIIIIPLSKSQAANDEAELYRVRCNSLQMDDCELFTKLRDDYYSQKGFWHKYSLKGITKAQIGIVSNLTILLSLAKPNFEIYGPNFPSSIIGNYLKTLMVLVKATANTPIRSYFP
jgi:hypothetical protein